MPTDGSDPIANYRAIRRELEEYSEALAGRPELIAATKLDLTGAETAANRLEQALGKPIARISSAEGRGIPALLGKMIEMIEDLPIETSDEPSQTVESAPHASPST